jgi:hypothetical protein
MRPLTLYHRTFVKHVAVTAPGVWYKTTGTGVTFDVNTCSPVTAFDTVVSVFSGSCASLSCIGYNDDFLDSDTCTTGLQSKLLWSTVPGEVYYIFVHSLSSNTEGPFELVLTDAPAPPTPSPTPPTPGACDNNFFLLILAIILEILTFGLVNLCD